MLFVYWLDVYHLQFDQLLSLIICYIYDSENVKINSIVSSLKIM